LTERKLNVSSSFLLERGGYLVEEVASILEVAHPDQYQPMWVEQWDIFYANLIRNVCTLCN